MPELTNSELLQPCLLLRLQDDEPAAKKEGRNQKVISLSRYKESVMDDLRWLLNAKAPPRQMGLDQYPDVCDSVINFGVPDFCGVTISALNIDELRSSIELALKRFEPRINRHTLQVRAVESEDSANGTVSFEISCELWAQPFPAPLFIRTKLDLETGEVEVR